jgi:hypothetical protein
VYCTIHTAGRANDQSISAKISPDEIEAEERKHRPSQEDVHVLRAIRQTAYGISTAERRDHARADEPSSFNPPNNVPAQPKRVRRVQ